MRVRVQCVGWNRKIWGLSPPYFNIEGQLPLPHLPPPPCWRPCSGMNYELALCPGSLLMLFWVPHRWHFWNRLWCTGVTKAWRRKVEHGNDTFKSVYCTHFERAGPYKMYYMYVHHIILWIAAGFMTYMYMYIHCSKSCSFQGCKLFVNEPTEPPLQKVCANEVWLGSFTNS